MKKSKPVSKKGEGRDDSGKFLKGYTHNPGGRPKGWAEFRDLCRDATPEAFNKIVELMQSSPSERIMYMAATYLLDQAWGKPTQAIEEVGRNKNPFSNLETREAVRLMKKKVLEYEESNGSLLDH